MKNVTDLYPLTPLQAGMLFHTVAAPGSGVYVQQLTCELVGPLDVAVFRAAWTRMVARHDVLRTAFLWEGLDAPVQVVRETVDVPWQVLDWRELSDAEVAGDLDRFLTSDRLEGFDVDQAPLLRVTVVRTHEQRHRLVWTFHHLLQDGWSTALLLEELFQDYRSLRDDEVPPSAALRASFRDYVGWTMTADLASAERFWRSRLTEGEAVTSLGVGKPASRTVTPSRHGPAGPPEQRELLLSEAATGGLTEVARRHRVTLNTVTHAAWALVMSRYGGASRVQYGATVSLRPVELAGVEHLVGPLVNTLPVRVDVAAEAALSDFLVYVQQELLEIRSHERTPLHAIADWTGTAGEDLFECILVFENYPVGTSPPGAAAGLELKDLEYLEQSNYGLAVLVVPGPRLRLIAIFDPDRYAAAVVTRVLGHLGSTLEAFVMDPEAHVGDLAPPHGRERARVLDEWSGALAARSASPDESTNVVQRLEMHAREHPDHAAVTGPDGTLTYAELLDRANALARRIRPGGSEGGEIIGLVCQRSVALPVGIFGILAAGNAYLPLDPDYPAARLRFMIRDAGLRRVLTTPRDLATARALVAGAADVLVMEDGVAPEAHVGEARVSPPARDDLAYVIYTSGSTGKPKGVMVSHGNLAFSTGAREALYGEVPSRFLLLSPISFDSSVAGLFWPLTTGGSVVLPPKGLERDPAALAHFVRDRAITHTLCLPSLYRLVLEQSDPEHLRPLDTVIVAGEACPVDLVDAHYAALPDTRLVNEYGPTEATVWAAAYPVPQGFDRRAVPIGRPIPGARTYVLGPDGRPVPAGVPGEIYIGGPGVTRGYLGRTEPVSAFVEDRFQSAGQPGSLYRTGDRGRFTDDGLLEFLGRVDDQVKVRGYRIEPREIEQHIRDHPAVADVVVTAVAPGAPGRLDPERDGEYVERRLTTLDRDRAISLLEEIERLPEPLVASAASGLVTEAAFAPQSPGGDG